MTEDLKRFVCLICADGEAELYLRPDVVEAVLGDAEGPHCQVVTASDTYHVVGRPAAVMQALGLST